MIEFSRPGKAIIPEPTPQTIQESLSVPNLDKDSFRAEIGESRNASPGQVHSSVNADEILLRIRNIAASSNVEASETVGLHQIPIPGTDEIRSLPIEEVLSRYQQAHSAFAKFADTMRSEVSRLGFSGRGDGDLEAIVTQRRGSYPGGDGRLMVWGIEEVSNLTRSELANSLEEAGYRSMKYATLENDTRQRIDPIPGGVMITIEQTQVVGLSVNKERSWLNPDSINHVGEKAISLNPDNFDQTLLGVIGFGRFSQYHEFLKELAEIMKANGPDQEYQRTESAEEEKANRIAAYNDAYLRDELTKKIAGLSIARDALGLLGRST